MDLGTEFSTWSSFSYVLEKYSKDNQVSYYVELCCPVERSNNHDEMPRNYPSKFKYCYAWLVCSHGRVCKESSKGANASCSSFILVCVNKTRTALVIVEADFNHTHQTSERFLMANKDLKGDERVIATVLLKGGVSLTQIQDFILSYRSQLGDDGNSRQKYVSEVGTECNDRDLIFCLNQLMAEDSDCVIEFMNFDHSPCLLYIQTSDMKKRIEQMTNANIQSIQFITSKLSNNEHSSVCYIVGVDKELNCHILASCVIFNRKESFYKHYVKTFVKHNQSFCTDCKGVVLDCSREEVDFVQLLFPQANIAWSRFFILECLEKEAESLSNLLQNPLIIFRKMMNSLSESEYEDQLKCLLEIANSSVSKEFLRRWDSCKELWVQYEIAFFDFLKHQKSAVEMDFTNIMCGYVRPDMTFTDVITSILHMDRNKEITDTRRANELHLNPYHVFYRSLCLSEAAEAVICQIALAEGSCYHVTNQTELVFIKRVDSEQEFVIDVSGDTCSCPFFINTELPCQHVFALRQLSNKTLCDESLIPLKWLVLGEFVTLNSLADCYAQVDALSSSHHDGRLKALQNVLKDILKSCGSHSYEDMGKDLVLLKNVLSIVKQGQMENVSKDTLLSDSEHNLVEKIQTVNLDRDTHSVPKKRGRKSKKEKELIAARTSITISTTESSLADENTQGKRHNLRRNIKHKFITRGSPPKVHVVPNIPVKSTLFLDKSESTVDNSLNILQLKSSKKGVDEIDLPVSLTKDNEIFKIDDLPKDSLVETFCSPESEREGDFEDGSPLMKRLKRDGSYLALKEDRYRIMKSNSDNEYSNDGSDSNAEFEERLDEEGLKKAEFEEDSKSSETRQVSLEHDLRMFVDNISIESLQELMQEVSMLEHVDRATGIEESVNPVDFVINSCCEDQENFDFVIRSLEKQVSDYHQFAYKLAASLILMAFNTRAQISEIRESINEWPSHLPQLSLFLSAENAGSLDTDSDQVLTVCSYKLHRSDIATLNAMTELSPRVIHSFLEVLAQRHNGKMFVIPFQVVHHWRNETYGEMLFKKVHFKTFDYLVLPIHCGAEIVGEDAVEDGGESVKPQWMVLIANVRNKTIGVLNPRTEDQYAIAANGYMIQWRRYMQIRSILTGEMLSAWTTEVLNCNRQTMDKSSGALLLMNVEAVISNVSPCVMTEAHIKSYMKYVGVTLRDTDRETTVLCVGGLNCQQMAAQDTDWLQCENCRAWWHRACSGHDDGSNEEEKSKKKIFYCSPCKQRIASVKSYGRKITGDVEKEGRDDDDEDMEDDDEDIGHDERKEDEGVDVREVVEHVLCLKNEQEERGDG